MTDALHCDIAVGDPVIPANQSHENPKAIGQVSGGPYPAGDGSRPDQYAVEWPFISRTVYESCHDIKRWIEPGV